jgi:hypothetical protein
MRAFVLALALVAPTVAFADEPAPPAPAPDDASSGATIVEPKPAPTVTPAPAPTPTVTPKPPSVLEAKPVLKPGSILRIPTPTQGPFAPDAPKGSMTPALIATATTGALLLAAGAAYLHHDALLDERPANAAVEQLGQHTPDDREAALRWHTIYYALFGMAVVSGGVTAYLWSARENVPTVHIDPINQNFRMHFISRF